MKDSQLKSKMPLLHFERLETSEADLYLKAMDLYKISFPIYEQRKSASQKEILKNKEYHFNLIYDDYKFVGIILYWETQDFIYVEHFCIEPEMRNKKYGQKALELLNQKDKTVILEIDPPVDETSIHRKGFYERARYKTNGFKHIHPAYHEEYGGHSLVVMSYPNRLTQEQYHKFNQYLKETVMGL